MKKTVLGSAMLVSGVIGFAIWQTSAASTASAYVYGLLAVVGFYLAYSSLKENT